MYIDPLSGDTLATDVFTHRQAAPSRTIAGVVSDCESGKMLGVPGTSIACTAHDGGYLTFETGDNGVDWQLESVEVEPAAGLFELPSGVTFTTAS